MDSSLAAFQHFCLCVIYHTQQHSCELQFRNWNGSFIISEIQCLLNCVIFPLGVKFFEQTAKTNFLNFCWVDLQKILRLRLDCSPSNQLWQVEESLQSTVLLDWEGEGVFFSILLISVGTIRFVFWTNKTHLKCSPPSSLNPPSSHYFASPLYPP